MGTYLSFREVKACQAIVSVKHVLAAGSGYFIGKNTEKAYLPDATKPIVTSLPERMRRSFLSKW